MNLQDYIPKPPPAPNPAVDFSDWTDPVLGMPVVAILAVILALAVVLAYAIVASRARDDDGRPPIETTP